MKVSPRFRVLGLLVLGLAGASSPACAQESTFGVSISASANPISTNDSVQYITTVTNFGPQTLTGVLITNALSSSVQILSYTPAINTLTNGNTVVFNIGPMAIGQILQTLLTVQPNVAGPLTNSVSVIDTNGFALGVAGFLVIQVTNAAAIPQTDLAVSLTGPAQQTVITNDYVSYGVTVSNLGPGDAPGVMLTNSLAGMNFITNSPRNLSRTFGNSNVVFNLGTLTNGAVTNLTLTVQPTNAGPLALSASVGSASVTETITNNNSASISLSVDGYLSTNLTVSIVSTQKFDPQNGLMEEAIQVSNVGTNAVASARVVVSGLTNQLYNAVGTNNGNPFVVYGALLDTNQSVELVLQYFVPTHRSVPVSLQAFGAPGFNLAPPAPAGTAVGGLRILQMSSGSALPGSMFIDFPSVSNRTYTVVYSDNAAFANALAAQPPVRAVANFTEWIDYGPPTTVNHPTNTATRFYRVFLNP